jgi:hypothetical protein
MLVHNKTLYATSLLILVALFFTLFFLVYASVFTYRWLYGSVNIANINLVSIANNPYPLCIGTARTGRNALYYTDFESLPSGWAMVNGSLSLRGFIGVQGYWSITSSGYKGNALRGFPLLWQVREHKTYTIYTPDIRFLPQTTNAIRIDSYSAGALSLGNGYLMLIAPRELFNNTVINTKLTAYFSYYQRTVGFIDLVNTTIDRRDDAKIFSTYDNWVPYWRAYGIPSYIELYLIYMGSSGTKTFNVNSSVQNLSGYNPYLTYVITMTDYWTPQTLYFDVFNVALFDASTKSLIYNFTFPYNRYSVVLERSRTTGDYGYLRFGIPGFTAVYWGNSIAGYTSLWISSKVRIASGVGWGGIVLTDTATRRYYVFAVNSSGYAVIGYLDGATWRVLRYNQVPGFSTASWYTLVLSYSRTGTTNSFTLYTYDTSGNLVATVSASDATFAPSYIGLATRTTNLLYVDAFFDDFLVSTADPRSVTFTNVSTSPSAGYIVAIYDNLGNLVNSSVATSSTALLGIVTDIVVGTGYDGRIVHIYPNGMTCLVTRVPNTDAILGGDTYIFDYKSVSIDTTTNTITAYIGFGSNRTIGPLFNISIYSGNTRYTYLVLDKTNSVIPSTLNLNISIVNYANQQTSKIQVINGVVQNPTTSAIALQGSNNYVLIEGYFTTRGQQATIRLNIVSCSAPDLGICISIPVTIYLSTV